MLNTTAGPGGVQAGPPKVGRIFQCAVADAAGQAGRLGTCMASEDHISSACGPRSRFRPAAWTAPYLRVLRGGFWNNNPQNLRSANRNRNQPDNRSNNVGFRVASTLCARAGGTTVPSGAHGKRSGPFMVTTVGARVAMGVQYHGGACLGRRLGSDRCSLADGSRE